MYVMFRMTLRMQIRSVVRVVLSLAMVAAVVLTTPLGGLVQERIATPHSNEGRLEIYGQVVDQVKEAPVFGYGGPREAQGPYLPQLGTQGGLWLVLYSHGIPGAILFVGFLAYVFWRTRHKRSRIQFTSHVVLLIGLAQLPVYGMLPAGIHILMAAAALSLRPQDLSVLESRESAQANEADSGVLRDMQRSFR